MTLVINYLPEDIVKTKNIAKVAFRTGIILEVYQFNTLTIRHPDAPNDFFLTKNEMVYLGELHPRDADYNKYLLLAAACEQANKE